MGGAWLVVLGGLATLATSCLVTSTCDGACEDEIIVTVELPRPPSSPGTPAPLDGATLELCRNDRCARGTFGAGIADQSYVRLLGATACGATASVQSGADGTPYLDIRSAPMPTCEPALRDGDDLTLTLTAAGGAVLALAARTVTYTTHTTCVASCRTAKVMF